MKTTAEMIEVMQAYERGEEIECLSRRGTPSWVKTLEPSWSWSIYDYRVKPVELIPDSFDFSHIDDRFVAVARDEDGTAWACSVIPKWAHDRWQFSGYEFVPRVDNLFASYKRGTVPPEQSLLIRPGYEGEPK